MGVWAYGSPVCWRRFLELRLNTALAFLRSPVLQVRIMGLQQIAQAIDDTSKQSEDAQTKLADAESKLSHYNRSHSPYPSHGHYYSNGGLPNYANNSPHNSVESINSDRANVDVDDTDVATDLGMSDMDEIDAAGGPHQLSHHNWAQSTPETSPLNSQNDAQNFEHLGHHLAASQRKLEFLQTWLATTGVFEKILSPAYLHTELLKRASPVPKFLLERDGLSDAHFQNIWRAAMDSSHESIRHGVYSLLQQLIIYMPEEKLRLLHLSLAALLKSSPDEIDAEFLAVLYELCLRSYGLHLQLDAPLAPAAPSLAVPSLTVPSVPHCPLGFDIFYDIALDDSGVSLKIAGLVHDHHIPTMLGFTVTSRHESNLSSFTTSIPFYGPFALLPNAPTETVNFDATVRTAKRWLVDRALKLLEAGTSTTIAAATLNHTLWSIFPTNHDTAILASVYQDARLVQEKGFVR